MEGKLWLICLLFLHVDRLDSKRMADGKLQLLSYLPFHFCPMFSVVVLCFCYSSAFKQKRTWFVVFVPKQEINQTLCSMCNEAYLWFSFSKCVYVNIYSLKTSRHSFVIPLIISLCEIDTLIYIYIYVYITIIIWKNARVHFSRCFRS